MFARSGTTPKSHVPITKLCKFYLRLLNPKAIAEKAAEHFFHWRLHLFLKCKFRADPPKAKAVVLIFWYLGFLLFGT